MVASLPLLKQLTKDFDCRVDSLFGPFERFQMHELFRDYFACRMCPVYNLLTISDFPNIIVCLPQSAFNILQI
jgi:hypothetical protein